MNFQIVPAYDVSMAEQAKVFNDAFAGYVAGSFELNANTLAAFMCAHGVDLCYSRFARDKNGALASFGFINRTANVTRLAGMGTVSAARRSGAARFLMSHLLAEAKARGDAAMVLEVIEQNPQAVALYRSCGFQEVTRLFGWRSNVDTSRSVGAALREIPISEGLQFPAALDYPALPWQISRHAAAKVASARAFTADDVAMVVSPLGPPAARIYAFLGCDGHNWEVLRCLTSSLLGKFPEQEFYTPAVYPEQFGLEIFQPLKFAKEPLSQFLMRKDL